MTDQFVLRPANLSDVESLSQLNQKTFRETYVEDLSIHFLETDLNSYFRSSTSPESFAKKIDDPKRAIWVIEDKTNDELVAFAAVGPCNVDDIPHPDVCSNEDGAIHRFYVQRDRQSHGLGQQLMSAILPWLEDHFPTRPIWLTLWSGNVKAHRFYTHYGFNKVGEFFCPVGEWKGREFIMKRQTNT